MKHLTSPERVTNKFAPAYSALCQVYFDFIVIHGKETLSEHN